MPFAATGGRAQRILYWFRTPPGVKVGRPALDEEAIRWIEEHNPDIEFDWPKILEAKAARAAARRRASSPRPARQATNARGRRAEASFAGREPSADQPTAVPEPSERNSGTEPRSGTSERNRWNWNLPEPTWNRNPTGTGASDPRTTRSSRRSSN